MEEPTRPESGDPGEIPEVVRARLVGLVAEVLPEIGRLPAPLRKIAGFAAGRRGRLGANLIAVELERDEEFRGRVVTQLRLRHGELTALVDETPETAEPVDVAAMTWLARPDGWEEAFATAVRRIEQRRHGEEAHREQQALAQATRRLEALTETLGAERAAHRAELADLKSQNSTLRRRLGDSRAAERRATERAQAAEQELRLSAERAAGARAEIEAEVRRLRRRTEELEAAAASGRRETRSERTEATLRARLLLDTLLEAGAGLRRELALPAVDGSPADRLEAEIEAAAGPRTAAGRPTPMTPALLEQHLSLPGARLIVDGYNVSKAAWPSSTLEAQRHRLVSGLAGLIGRTGAETTVVFDGAESEARGVGVVPRGVKVLFSPAGVIADDVIRSLVAVEPGGRAVLVVTSDRALAVDVAGDGARVVASDVLTAHVVG